MEEFMNVLFNYGVGFACVGYLMYFQSTTMNKILDTLSLMNTRLSVIEDKLENKKTKKAKESDEV